MWVPVFQPLLSVLILAFFHIVIMPLLLARSKRLTESLTVFSLGQSLSEESRQLSNSEEQLSAYLYWNRVRFQASDGCYSTFSSLLSLLPSHPWMGLTKRNKHAKWSLPHLKSSWDRAQREKETNGHHKEEKGPEKKALLMGTSKLGSVQRPESALLSTVCTVSQYF